MLMMTDSDLGSLLAGFLLYAAVGGVRPTVG